MIHYRSHISVFFPMGKLLCLCMVMLTISSKSYSQTPGKKETIEFLQKVAPGQVKFELKASNLTITVMDSTGAIVREDKVNFGDLDTTFKYEQESGLVVCSCLKDARGCVTRTMPILKIKRQVDRFSVPAKDNQEAERFARALNHLIRMETFSGYTDAITLE